MSLAALRTPSWAWLRPTPAFACWLVLCGCLALAACGGSEDTADATFPPADYSYLSKLRLNVGTLSIVDHVQDGGAGPGDIGQTAPVPPDQALQRMAQDRLVAAGNSGSAVFTIDRAAIIEEPGGTLDGRMAVHLDIVTTNGGHAGYAEAHVSRQLVPGDPDAAAGTRRQLYDLNRQMMQDMNVELEFQLRRSLRDWLVDAGGAPLAGSVEQQNLSPPGNPGYAAGPPGSAPVGTTPVGAVPVGPGPDTTGAPSGGPLMLAPPGGEAPPAAPAPAPVEAPSQDPAAAANPDPVFPDGAPPGDAATPAPAPQRSAPPSYLQAPAGVSPTPGATPPGY
ncbi:hypothetical protein [Lichenicoccus sp.]|uniref:hypothetical protein n=1 Tax=Lichenicoccus sp. TaxID=2781899 RepID=UPI003D104EC4